MIPETFAFIADLTAQAHALGMEVLVEVHGHHQDQIDVARQVDWVYDFALPPLVLHTLYTRDVSRLMRWLEIRPRNAVTVLDTHDGIGVQDVDERPTSERAGTARPARTSTRSSRRFTSAAAARAAWPAAARRATWTRRRSTARSTTRSAAATPNTSSRAPIQCFVPGIPQIYYVGLLAGGNDMELLRRTGVGRDINRHYYTSGGAAARS